MTDSPLGNAVLEGALIGAAIPALIGFGWLFYRQLRKAYESDLSWQEKKRCLAADQAHRTAVLDSLRYFDLATHMDRSGLASGANLLRDEALRLAASVHTGIRIRRGCADE